VPINDNYGQGFTGLDYGDSPDLKVLGAGLLAMVGQTVMRFASATARAATLTSPLAGMTTWRQDAKTLDVYDGTSWGSVAIPVTKTWTPVFSNQGSATFSTITGVYAILGPLVWVNLYAVVNVAGTGTNLLNVTMPTNVDRTRRQILTLHTETVGAGGNSSSHVGGGEAVFLTSGSGSVTDRLRIDEGGTTGREQNIEGVDLLTGGSLTIQGMYLQG